MNADPAVLIERWIFMAIGGFCLWLLYKHFTKPDWYTVIYLNAKDEIRYYSVATHDIMAHLREKAEREPDRRQLHVLKSANPPETIKWWNLY